jgi:flagellar biosynthesis/type III secretory pathway M-ring protein FliF/YscJ
VDIVGIVNVAAAVLGFVAIGVLVVIAVRPDRDRMSEDAARAHYDEHGRWPDDPS